MQALSVCDETGSLSSAAGGDLRDRALEVGGGRKAGRRSAFAVEATAFLVEGGAGRDPGGIDWALDRRGEGGAGW